MRGPKATLETILSRTRQYYNKKLGDYGPTPRGVDWNSAQSQELRFEQLLKIGDTRNHFTLNDYGCGYGALAAYMIERNFNFEYNGFDISMQMIDVARKRYGHLDHCGFLGEEQSLAVADYTVASGIFNVKQEISNADWTDYMLDTLKKIARISEKGFSFNVLTKYSDPGFMRDDLFYADPNFLFDYCKKNFSRFVAILHDYPLYEFTILVRMEVEENLGSNGI